MALSLRRRGAGGGARDGEVRLDVVVTQDDLRDLVRAINRHGDAKAVRKELRDGLREGVKPLVPLARTRVLAQPGGRRSTGLRRDMARAVQLKVDLGLRSERIGVRIRLDGKKLRGRPAGLVGMYEGVKPWRHPVFGTGVWVQQPARGFLTDTVRPRQASVVRHVERVMDAVGRKLDG